MNLVMKKHLIRCRFKHPYHFFSHSQKFVRFNSSTTSTTTTTPSTHGTNGDIPTLPSFIENLRSNDEDLKYFDVKWKPIPEKFVFKFPTETWNAIPEADRLKLTELRKEYILIGESYGFPDFQDNPYRFHPMNASYLYYDPSSKQEKVLVQLTKDMPPLLWIPIRADVDALKRTFQEFVDIEGRSIAGGILGCEKMLESVTETEPLKKRKQMLDYINNIDPRTINDEHPKSCILLMGKGENEAELEKSFMNNPFVFNTPLLLGTTNNYVQNHQVIVSKFRTIASRSIIALEMRKDLQVDLEYGNRIPVFARINYPYNERFSRPCAARINRIFGTNYPEDMPVDVIAALLGYSMKDYTSFREQVRMASEDESLPAYNIAILAILKDPEFSLIFDKFSKHPDPSIRIACIKGALELNMKDKIQKLSTTESNPEVMMVLEKAFASWKKIM